MNGEAEKGVKYFSGKKDGEAEEGVKYFNWKKYEEVG